MKITIAVAIQRTVEHREIFHDEMLHVMRQIMSGELTQAQIAGFVMGLRVKKETIGEISAAAQVMREFATQVAVGDDKHLVDTCGTGGDSAHTFNVSTAAAIVRARSGHCKNVGASGGGSSPHGGSTKARGPAVRSAAVQRKSESACRTTPRPSVWDVCWKCAPTPGIAPRPTLTPFSKPSGEKSPSCHRAPTT